MSEPILINWDAGKARAPMLLRFLESQSFVRLLIGPWGSGKSSVCCAELLLRAREVPAGADGVRRSRWAVIRNTYRELEDTTIKTFEQWLKPELGRWRMSDMAFDIEVVDAESDVPSRVFCTACSL